MEMMNMTSWLANVVVGGGMGVAIGYFGQCSTGTCPLTSTWWRGGLYGACLGLMIFLLSGGDNPAAMNQSSKNVAKIGEADFEAQVRQAPQLVVVDFFATWCGPCRAQAPILDALAAEYAGQVKFVKINADEASNLAGRYEIRSLPTLLFFKNGQVAGTHTGLATAANLKQRLQTLLAANPAAAAAQPGPAAE